MSRFLCRAALLLILIPSRCFVAPADFQGSVDCPCIDSVFPDLLGCQTGDDGTFFCYPESFGASVCASHDLSVDPLCSGEEGGFPEYCTEKWCFVDFEKCKASSERMFLSDTAPDAGLYYSYSTCNSSETAWSTFLSTQNLKGKYLTVTIPGYWSPAHYKLNSDGVEASWDSAEFYNDSVPWFGWTIEYLEALASVTEIGGFNYTFRSGGADDIVGGTSAWTAAVHDVANGLSDLSASSFWITSERLQLVPFTTIVDIDKVYVWVEQPTVSDSFKDNYSKMLQPFTYELWGCFFASVVFVAFMTVWFANEHGHRRRWWLKLRGKEWNEAGLSQRTWIVVKVGVESLLADFTFFFGHTVEYDISSNLATKILLCGYAFLVCVAVAAYTANLAAYLTRLAVGEYISTLEEAIAQKLPICVHPVFENDIQTIWPGGDYVINTENDDLYLGLLDSFDAGKCKVLVAGIGDIVGSTSYMEEFCARDIVSTGTVVVEKPVALPISRDLAAGFSYYMLEAEKAGVSFSKFQQTKLPEQVCPLFVSSGSDDSDDLLSLTPQNFALPFTVLVGFALLALVVHFFTTKSHKKKQDANMSEFFTVSDSENEALKNEIESENVSKQEHAMNEDTIKVESMNGDTEANMNGGSVPKVRWHDSTKKYARKPENIPKDLIYDLMPLLEESETGNMQSKLEALKSLQAYQYHLVKDLNAQNKHSKKTD